MATNNNINYGPAALPGTVPTPVLGNNIDRAPAPVDPGVGTGYVPTVTRPVVPVTEQPVINPPIVVARTAVVIPAAEQPVSEVVAESTTEPNIPASNQQRYLTILANGSVVTDNASTLDFEGNGFTITSSGPYGAVITLTGTAGYGNSNVATFLANYGSNNISTVGNITGNFVAPGGNGQVMYNRNGVIGASPNDFNFDQSTETLYVTTGSFAGSANTGIDAVYGGVPGYTVLGSAIMAQFTGNTNTYSQVNFQNINNGTRSSGDYIITANNGTDSTYYLDLGLAGNNHADPAFFGDTSTANDGYLYVNGASQAGPGGGVGNLIIGSTNGVIKMFVGNTAQANVKATVDSAGLSVTGNVRSGNALVSGIASASGNITGGNVLTAGVVSATGNITGGNLLTGGLISATSTITSAANVTGGNILTGGVISATANVTGGNLNATGLSLSGNVVSALVSAANITTTANISGNYILGNGSQLTGVNSVTVDVTDTNGLTTIYYPTFVENRTTAQIARADVDLTYRTDDNLLTVGNVSVTGNITGGNLLTGGLISATSTITSAANITGGNVLTGGLISATSTITSAANITGGNVLTGGLISATANITGGNVTTAGLTSTASLSITGNTATVTTANYSIGYLNVPQVSLAANATIALTDSGKHYYSVSASNLALTIANNTSVSWSVGTAITIVNAGTANILINQGTGVSMYQAGNATSGNRVLATFGMATIMNTAANVWFINGTGLT